MSGKTAVFYFLIPCICFSCCRNTPDNPTDALKYAKTCFLQNNPEKALSLLLSIVEKHPRQNEAYLWLIRAFLQTGKIHEAEELGEELLRADPADPRILSLLGVCREEQGDYQQAISFYRKAIVFKEELAVNHLRLGRLYYQTGNLQSAETELNHARCLLGKDTILFTTAETLVNEIRKTKK